MSTTRNNHQAILVYPILSLSRLGHLTQKANPALDVCILVSMNVAHIRPEYSIQLFLIYECLVDDMRNDGSLGTF